MSDTGYTPTFERVRDLYSWAYAWRTRDDLDEGETDLSGLRESNRAEFDRALQAHDRQVAAKALTDLLTPESMEAARLQIEDVLIEWRDSRLFVLRNNGLVVAEKDGTRSHIIRMGFEDAFALVIRARAASPVPGNPEPTEARAEVATTSSAACIDGYCPSGCSHLMWACRTCSCEGGWGAPRARLEQYAADHTCPEPTSTTGAPNE